jgi:hypothetical protein
MNNKPDNFSKNTTAATYGDIIYKKVFTAFNGVSNSVSAKIIVSVDPDGVIKPSEGNFDGAVPGKIQFFTANDNGRLIKVVEMDKAGRLITNEHWSVTKNPSGNPLLLMLNTNDPGHGATLSLRRSRGTYDVPTSVVEKDSIFKISWYAHDGQSYKETSAIHSTIDGEVSLGSLPTSLTFKTFDQSTGVPSDSLKINVDKSIALKSITSLDGSFVLLNSPVVLPRIPNENIRDQTISSPIPGTLIFLIDLDVVQVYTHNQGWRSLF